MKIMGIDPGLVQTGFGIILNKESEISLVDYDNIYIPELETMGSKELGQSHISLVSGKRIVGGQLDGKGLVTLNMGVPELDWQDIPLSYSMDTLHLNLARQDKSGLLLGDPVAVGMGNPHVVFFVPDVDSIDLSSLGPDLETDPLFPEKTNVSIVSFCFIYNFIYILLNIVVMIQKRYFFNNR